MKKFSIVSFCAMLICCITSNAQEQTSGKLTLQQAIEIGLKNNLDVQQGGLQAETDKVNHNQARMNLLPDLNGNISGGLNFGRSIDPTSNSYINQQANVSNVGLSSGVILFNGFNLQNTVKQTGLAYQASKMDWQQTKDNITINIILAYLQVLSNEDLLAQSKIQADLSRQQVERLEMMDKEGAIKPSELFELRGQYANDQLAIISAKNSLENSRIALAQLMNVPNDKNVQLERINAESYATKYDATPENIYQTALQEFAQVKAVDLRTESAIKGLKAARGAMFPTLSLNGSLNTNYSSASRSQLFPGTFTDVKSQDFVVVNNTPTQVFYRQPDFTLQKVGYTRQLSNNLFNSVSLNLQIPFFRNLLLRNRVKLAKIEVKNREIIATNVKTRLQQLIDQAYVNMTTAADRYKTLLEQVEAYTQSFRAAEARFSSGVGNSIDYVIVKNNLDRANLNSITAKYDYVLRTKILDYYQGKQLW